MNSRDSDLAAWKDFLAAHPAFERDMRQFITLHDAAAILDELKPPHGDTAAAFLREVGTHVLRRTGLPEDFLAVFLAKVPPPSG